MQPQQQKKRQKIMQQMAFDYLRLLADYELLGQMDNHNHNINNKKL
ncbi:MAG: hypothetical protein IJJ56_06020 [Prevotella sp.]|nr:hypothetical protein [Prevotella sp.]